MAAEGGLELNKLVDKVEFLAGLRCQQGFANSEELLSNDRENFNSDPIELI